VSLPAANPNAVPAPPPSSPIYLDNGGTTALDPAVHEGLYARLALPLGNPNAAHGAGRAAREMLEAARSDLAALFGGKPEEVVFTSGGTESITLALHGCTPVRTGRVAISAVEHSATRTAALALAAQGMTVDIVPVTPTGRVTEDALAGALHPDTRIVSLMLAQNEIGTISDLATLIPVVRRLAPRARVVVDAVQGFTKVPVRLAALGADCVAITAHKMHGPLGIGALWTRVPLNPLFKGGGQERGQRGGTQPAVLAWGLTEAARRAFDDVGASARMAALRDRLVAEIGHHLPDASLTGEPPGPTRLPNNAHFCIPGLPSEPLINALAAAGVAASAGAACSTGKARISPTLQALGRRAEEGAFVRLTVGRFTTEACVVEGAARLAACVEPLRRAYAGR
jgi:cysteine desulfurase